MVKRSRYVDDYEEDTDIYETTHVDPIALNHVFHIVKRLRKGKGFVGPQSSFADDMNGMTRLTHRIGAS